MTLVPLSSVVDTSQSMWKLREVLGASCQDSHPSTVGSGQGLQALPSAGGIWKECERESRSAAVAAAKSLQ